MHVKHASNNYKKQISSKIDYQHLNESRDNMYEFQSQWSKFLEPKNNTTLGTKTILYIPAMILEKTCITLQIKILTCLDQLITCIKMSWNFTILISSPKFNNNLIKISSYNIIKIVTKYMTSACLNQLITNQYSIKN